MPSRRKTRNTELPRHVADSDKPVCLSDGLCRHPTGRFCVIMPITVAIPADTHAAHDSPPLHHAKAA
jgi:hypothetical protein